MSTGPANVFKLKPTVQSYDWGKVGRTSKVAQLAEAGDAASFKLEEATPYAEMWMGTHPTSPSHVQGHRHVLSLSDLALKTHLAANTHLIGSQVNNRFKAHDGDVPFLFKVLSINKALSIQTHPDKKTAEKLHAEQPHIYKDDNHKPEMAIALTPFTALCGFRPLTEIANFLTSTPEFAALVPHTIAARFVALASSSMPEGQEEKAALRDLFAAVMTAEAATVKTQLETLIKRYTGEGSSAEEDKEVVNLVVTLNEQFPGDIGIFCAYLLNYLKLQPGEAIFLGAGEPHAYVSGDVMECMATSDNVIRAGLTPKLRDIPNLVAGLTYTAGDPKKHFVQPTPFSPSSSSNQPTYSQLYDPPIPEFAVVQVALPRGVKDAHRGVAGPSIAAVTEGSGTVSWASEGEELQEEPQSLELKMGDVLFIGADVGVSFESGKEGLTLYRAFVEA